MHLLTSFSPKRIERQNECLRSWINAGNRVTAVQSPGEIEVLEPQFPGVAWKETDQVGDVFGKPYLIRIKALLNEITDEPGILINSDIEIRSSRSEFEKIWQVPASHILKVGIRWDVHPRRNLSSLFKSGIDAFLVNAPLAAALKDIGLVMGCPFWDYWIPWEAKKFGYQIQAIKQKCLFHTHHTLNWSDQDYILARKCVEENCGVLEKNLYSFIQRETGRESARERSMRRRRRNL
jgi:hypothetical protein